MIKSIKRNYRHLLIVILPTILCATSISVPTVYSLIETSKALISIRTNVIGTEFSSSFEPTDPIAKTNSYDISPVGFKSLNLITGNGPSDNEGWNIANNVGFTGLKTFNYEGQFITGDGNREFGANIYDDLDVEIGNDFVFNYKILPTLGTNGKDPNNADLNYPSSYISVDLLYNDSDTDKTSNLKSLASTGIKDQYGYGITPKEQGDSKVLYSGQWNSKEIDLSSIVGKHIHKIVLNYQNDNQGFENELIKGYVDDIQIHNKPKIDSTHLTNYVDTRRGTNASDSFSRGNNFPATALPNGFNFYTPMTNSRSDWMYSYKQTIDANNHPTLNGIGISHEPSPWMGDREQFNIMPSILDTVNSTPDGRKLSFVHENEIAKPDYYSVTFDNGIQTEIAPASHSAIFRITSPSDKTSLIFDSKNGTDASFDLSENGVLKGYVNNASGMNAGASKMFIYAEFSQDCETIGSGDGSVKYAAFDTSSDKTIIMKIATSYMNEEQAHKNLQLEITNDNLSFDQLHSKATDIWQKRLNAINLNGSNATDTQKVTLYSNLYRLNLYPNEYFENTGDNIHPKYQYKSPVISGNPIKDGKLYVNNGFWDTYRTVWPAYSLLYPEFTQELVNGFLYQYRDSGYVARWSSPGHADSMTGTSSDAAFSDAYISGAVTDLSVALDIYNSGLNDAFRYSADSSCGRKGLEYSNFLGYTPLVGGWVGNNSSEVISWSLEGYINDYALGQTAIKLANESNLSDDRALQATGQTKQEIKDTGNFLLRRANAYPNLFDHQTGFFRGKDRNGNWAEHQAGQAYNPLDWHYEYTETNAWNYAFTVPFDVPGLMSLYGGQNQFLNKLDQFFSTPETAQHPGSYGGTIHEMLEARDVRMGQLGMSNQPSHHIPYMYAAGGKPYKTQALTREILQRLYVGSDIGQGYCGDEDNGEMSAWYILSSLGIYDLSLGSGKYILTSPLFKKVQITRDNGNKLTINANNNNLQNKYISSVSLDNKKQDDVYVDQNKLLNGNHTLTFNMSSTPTAWGEKNIDPVQPSQLVDTTNKGELTSSDGTDLTNLIDKNSNEMVEFQSNNVTLFWRRKSNENENDNLIINALSLTSTVDDQKFNSIRVFGSDNNKDWNILGQYINERFKFSQFTREFCLDTYKNYQNYKIELSMDTNISLAELQLLESDYQPYKINNAGFKLFAIIFLSIITLGGIIIIAIVVPTTIRNTKKWKRVLKVQQEFVDSDHIV